MPWFESGQALRNKGWTYEEIAKHHGLTEGGVRNRFYLERKRQGETKSREPQSPNSTLKLLAKHKKGLEINQLCDQLGMSERVLYATLDDLRDEGYIVTETKGLIILQRIAPLEENHIELDWQGNQVIRFGVVSDTHLGSKWQQLTHLNTIYDIYEREGIRLVFNAGDLTEGVGMRRGHEFEVFTHGADEQVAYVIEHYPKRDGIVTQFITGNHDHSAIKQSGHDIGAPIERARPDMVYLGRSSCKVNITPNCIVEINHPLDGACFDDQTEIFTKDGWKSFGALRKEDYVATMTKKEHEFQWQQPMEITKLPYAGDMIHFKSRTVDMMVTPNHGLWVREYPKPGERKRLLTHPNKSHLRVSQEWRRETAEHVTNTYYRQKWQMTNCAKSWKGHLLSDVIEIPRLESKNLGMVDRMQHLGTIDLQDWCELVAWYVTEGSAGEKRVSISQCKQANPINHEQIKNLLDRLGLRYGIYNHKDIEVNSKELASVLARECGVGSERKRIPEYIKELPTKYLKLVFETLIKGDGWERGARSFGYRSISQRLRDDVTEIALKLGYAVSGKDDTVLITGKEKQPTINSKPKRVPYKGLVFCCRVPNGLILVRRNGRATWSHNSYAISYALQKMIDAMPGGGKPNIYLGGHHHKAMYLFYRNIHAFECGTTQAQTPWMRGKRLPAHMGGWIIEVHVDDEGTITRCGGEFIPFYTEIENDY